MDQWAHSVEGISWQALVTTGVSETWKGFHECILVGKFTSGQMSLSPGWVYEQELGLFVTGKSVPGWQKVIGKNLEKCCQPGQTMLISMDTASFSTRQLHKWPTEFYAAYPRWRHYSRALTTTKAAFSIAGYASLDFRKCQFQSSD